MLRGEPEVVRFLFHRTERVEIVRLVPRTADVRARRHDVGEVHEAFAAVAEQHRLMVPRMAAGDDGAYARDDAGVAIDRFEHRSHRRENLRRVAIRGVKPFVARIAGNFEFAFLHEDSRARKRSFQRAGTAPVRSMLEAIDGDTDIVAGVRAVVTGGHTRDHQAALVSDAAECFMHLADIVPTRSHIRGPWNQAYDLDVLRTMEQKARYLGLAAEQRWWLSFAHDDTVFAAMVKNDRGRIVLGDTVPVSERLFQSSQ